MYQVFLDNPVVGTGYGQQAFVARSKYPSWAKRNNWEQKQFLKVIERQAFLEQLPNLDFTIDAIIHLGARTDTTEFDYAVHDELNVKYSKALWLYATEKQIPFIYASSAATYGSGEQGYEDSHTILDQLTPLNPYGVSKNEFDKWESKGEYFWEYIEDNKIDCY